MKLKDIIPLLAKLDPEIMVNTFGQISDGEGFIIIKK